MKIGIAAGRIIIDENYDLDMEDMKEIEDIKILYSWNDINKHNKLKDAIFISKDFFDTVKILEYNILLEQEIKKFRQKFKIPDNLDFIEFHNNNDCFRKQKTEKENDKISWQERMYLHILLEGFNMPQWFKENVVNNGLFYTNVMGFINIKTENITFEVNGDNFSSAYRLDISINTTIKKNTLISYINKNWKKISAEISKLPPLEKYSLSDRDIRIVDLKNEGKTYRQITDIIAKKFKDKDSNFDEATIKTAYLRAKKLISSVFERKSKHKTT
jgi:hypothetical protein